MIFYLPQISLQIIKINYLMHKRLKLRASIGTLIEEGLEFYDEKLDKEIEQSTQNAVDVCGDDVGVPIIHLDDGDNQNAIFGPIISEVPNLEDSIKLWEHFKYVCFNENVAELKRKRSIPLNPTVD